MTKQRKVARTIEPETMSDGAGVVLKRGIGTQTLNYLDPFLLFDHFGSSNPDEYIAGFPTHPHRGIETVTYMLKGIIKHKDSSGNEGVLEAGDVQWMTAGSGIMHEEMPQIRQGEMEGFQLWVNLPAKSKMMKPRYQEFKKEALPGLHLENGVKVSIIAGEIGDIKGAISDIEAAPTYLDIEMPSETVFKYAIPSEHSVFAYVFRGTARFQRASDAEVVSAPRLVVFGEGETVEMESSEEGARLLLISGKPFNEPIARYGPFVMNTKEEIREAISDLQRGTFVKS